MNYQKQCPNHFDLLDAEPIRLSSLENNGFNIEEIEFILGESDGIFTDAKSSAELQRVLADSDMATDVMDLDLNDFFQEELESEMDAPSWRHTECDSMRVNSMQEVQDKVVNKCGNMINHNISSAPDHKDEEPQAYEKAHQIIQLNDVVLDHLPTPINRRQCQHQRQRRRLSCSDLPQLWRQVSASPPSLSGSNQAATSSHPQRRATVDSHTVLDLGQLADGNSIIGGANDKRRKEQIFADKQRYQEAVTQLAHSMRRTELSRRQLEMLGLPVLRPQSQPVTYSAREQLQHRVAGAHFIAQSTSLGDDSISSCSVDKPSFVSDFFSGRRTTLTEGLEHSRTQLKMYLNRIDNI